MKKIRCAIYTRKSAEEGLEQEFNSLDAQREACAAYVASQKAEGWVLLPTVYEDAGLSGGTLERPGLQRLLDDIDAGLVDRIVVYKVDRLTRSLSDFAKLVDRLDAASTGFVSVTQSFNTATSMGRLTLHMLLSFAQFEREVTAERIRDKVAASKRKGLWMGGRVPLGYEKDERTLRINEAEAETVRTLYALYRKHGTLRQVKADADRLRLRTKQRFAADGTRTGGLPFRRGHLHCLLTNPLYAGRIRHQRRVYEGQHPSIIAPELWDAVQAQLQAGAAKPRKRTTKGRAARSPLAGKLFDETGDRLTPSHTKRKNGQRLRYYVSRRLIQHSGQKDLSGWRLPAPMLEQTVVHLIRQHVDATTFSASLTHTSTMQELASVRRFLDGLCSDTNDDSASAAPLLRLIRRVDISPGSVSILLDRNAFAACLSMGRPSAFARMHSASSHRSACVDAASRPSSFWATPRNPSTAHSCAISPTPSPGSTESKQAKPMSRLPPKTPSQRTACARQSVMPSWLPTSSAPLSKAASPLG